MRTGTATVSLTARGASTVLLVPALGQAGAGDFVGDHRRVRLGGTLAPVRRSTQILRQAVERARVGDREKLEAIKRLKV